jgi:hypothetical protein
MIQAIAKSKLGEALRYKSESCLFDARLGLWDFLLNEKLSAG